MDSNMIITWSIIILTTISLIAYFQIKNRNREKKTFSALQYFALENDGVISSYDHLCNTLIGIDNREITKLFFIRTTPNKDYREAINLSEIMGCQLHKVERTAHYKGDKVSVIDKIELILSFVDTKKPDVALEFFNTDYDQLTLSGELQLAQKWSGMIKSNVNTNREWKEKENEFFNPIGLKPHESLGVIVNNRKNKKPVQKEYAI